jgi:hypothetical protein
MGTIHSLTRLMTVLFASCGVNERSSNQYESRVLRDKYIIDLDEPICSDKLQVIMDKLDHQAAYRRLVFLAS